MHLCKSRAAQKQNGWMSFASLFCFVFCSVQQQPFPFFVSVFGSTWRVLLARIKGRWPYHQVWAAYMSNLFFWATGRVESGVSRVFGRPRGAMAVDQNDTAVREKKKKKEKKNDEEKYYKGLPLMFGLLMESGTLKL